MVDRSSALAYPRPYSGAEYTYLKGTGTNKTHWTVTVRCRGCTAWSSPDGANTTTISSTGTTLFAWAMASTAPKSPKDNTSMFSEHDKVNQWQHNMDYARSPLFDTWVAGNLLQSTSSTRRPAPHLLAVCLQLAPPQGPPARTHLAFLLEQTEVYRQGVLLDVPCQPTVLESPHLNIPVKWPNTRILT
jgi:hypothetical protein